MKRGPGTISVALAAPEVNYDLNGYLFSERDRPLDKAVVDDIESDKVKLFVYGQILYRDIFDVAHWTKFCCRYRPHDQKYEATERFNDADNNRAPPPKEATASGFPLQLAQSRASAEN